MDEFKITLFESEYSECFPKYVTLAETNCNELANELSVKYKLRRDTLEDDMFNKQFKFKDYNALDGFELIKTLFKLEIIPLERVFINWYMFKQIDEFDIKDVDKYFDDIWFPSSDDIDIFDKTLDWVLTVRHDGFISYLKYT